MPGESRPFESGDVVRVKGEDFDSVVKFAHENGEVTLGGWPETRVQRGYFSLVKAYEPNAANLMQHACRERDEERKRKEAERIARQCKACGGSGIAKPEPLGEATKRPAVNIAEEIHYALNPKERP
jgi:hypothetical protein